MRWNWERLLVAMNWERRLVVDEVLAPGVFGQSVLAFSLELHVLLRVGFRVELVEHVDEKVEAARGVHRRLEVLDLQRVALIFLGSL